MDIIHPTLPDAEYLALIETDVATEPQLVLDTLLRIRYQGEECGVNVEIQGYPDPTIPHRCFEYGMRVSILHQLPILSVVLWRERRGPLPPTPYVMRI